MSRIVRTPLILLLALAFVAPVFADTDPTLHQVYEAASTGQLEQAQQMMNEVLRDHPKSAKAHYVAAELYARQGKSSLARQQLNTAQSLAPGLPFAKPEAVQALQRELSQGEPLRGAAVPAAFHTAFPWVAVVLVLSAVGILLFIFRRRNSPTDFRSQYSAGMPTPTPGNSGGASVAPNVGAGVGSGIAGGLASGLAVGAGVVAGEEIARHLLDPNRPEGSAPAAGNTPVENPPADNPENGDMGGSNFGVPDDDSWDDDSGSVGGDLGGGDDDSGGDWN